MTSDEKLIVMRLLQAIADDQEAHGPHAVRLSEIDPATQSIPRLETLRNDARGAVAWCGGGCTAVDGLR